MKFRRIKAVDNTTQYYASDIQTNLYDEEYIIYKTKKGYNLAKFYKEYNSLALTVSEKIDRYITIYSGFQTLRDAKEYAMFEI